MTVKRNGIWRERVQRVLVTAVGLSMVAGCGAGDTRRLITGSVTLDGEPLSEGQIVFEPTQSGRMSVAQIIAGSYALPDGFGLPPGEYRIRITSQRPTGEKVKPAAYSQDQSPVDVYQQFLPAKYNVNSVLSITVSADGDLRHDFALSSH